ncbi:ATP-binding protein, partial [Actinomyces wuliandei]
MRVADATGYRPRVVDTLVTDIMGYSGGLLLEGVRACGKTMTGRHHCASEVALDSGLPQVQAALDLDPALLLDGAAPRLVDEWQVAPVLWNVVRREIDRRQAPGQFILTGSAVPSEDAARHSGAHRISRVRMRPMTLFERGLGDGRVSLAALFAGELPDPVLDSTMTVPDALDALVHGGWPGDLGATTTQAQRHLRDYVDDIVSTDVGRLDREPRRDPLRLQALLRSLARNVATEASFATLVKDASTQSMRVETAVAYVNALKRLFVVEEQQAWAPHLRSRYAVRTSPKLHLVDPALAAAVTSTSTQRLMHDLPTAGLWFESQVVQHLRVFAEALGGRVYHYRDKAGKEADAVVELDDGR